MITANELVLAYSDYLMTNFSSYLSFDRAQWCLLKADMACHLTAEQIQRLHGRYESISFNEVMEIYLPLSRLLSLYVTASQDLFQVTSQFLGYPAAKVPYIIGIAGSVAVGKSTTSRVLQALLSQWASHPRVEIVTTDGFLFPNAVLEQKNLMQRKGFPESYDLRRLIAFLSDLKAGCRDLEVPIYSHQLYNITSDTQVIPQVDVVILEGLNILQHNLNVSTYMKPLVFVTDYLDFSIYVDADSTLIEKWYLDRFMKFRNLSIHHPSWYLHQYAHLSDEEALDNAKAIWTQINALNLVENILPYRERAQLILTKGVDHAVKKVCLRKL